jgi:magnesium transporter
MIRIYSYSRESNRMETSSIAELPRHLGDRGRTIWVDLENPTDEETGVLGGMFGFHILTVEDCIDDAWLPKEDLYDGYSYSIFYAAAPDRQDRLAAQKLDIFVGPNFLVTHHLEEIKGIFDTRGVVAKNPGSLLRSSDWLLHGILNTVIDYCKPALDGLEARIDSIVEARDQASKGLDDSADLHSDLTLFRIITENQQSALKRFAYSEDSFVSEENRDYFRDVYDHNRHLHHRTVQGVDRLAWALQTVRASDTRRSQNAIRWGVVVLTALMFPLLVVGALALPPQIIRVSERLSPVVLGVAIVYLIGVFVLFKQKRWF